MTSLCMSIAQTVSSKLCAGKKRFSSCTEPAQNFLSFPTICKSYINPSFRVDLQNSQNRKTFKHHLRARKLGPEKEEKEDDDEEDFLEKHEEDDNEEDFLEKDEKKDDNKDDFLAEETVLKLYSDIKNQNIDGISEVIGDECQCFCNFLSTCRLLQGKKQVMAFFYWLMMKLGKDIKIIVKPTSKDGMTIGVQWQLEWEKPHIQLGKGFSFHICHIYQGKLLIKNVEMFMEPIFHIEPLRLRTIAFAVILAEKIVTYIRPAENTRRQAISLLLLALLLLAAAAFYFTRPRF